MTDAATSRPLVDLRSDTFTKPTAEMRRAMAEAEVGDDVVNEDATCAALEQLVARTAGKPAGLFCPSGTMCNLIAVFVHVQLAAVRGAVVGPSEMIVGNRAHMACYEAGGASVCASTYAVQMPNQPDGTLLLDDVAAHIASSRSCDVHLGATKLVCLENTHNKCGGVVLPVEYCWAMRRMLDAKFGDGSVGLHLDGARAWNAAVKLGLPLADVVAPFHTASLCLSKGLGAPVGSVLVGSQQAIDLARRFRKLLGGGMRQAGIIAAGGIYAVQHNVQRLQQDHDTAQQLSAAVRAAGFDTLPVHTNIVIWRMPPGEEDTLSEFCAICLKDYGVKLSEIGRGMCRAVPHLGSAQGDAAVSRVVEAIVGARAKLQKQKK